MKLGLSTFLLIVGVVVSSDDYTVIYRNGTREKVQHASVKQNSVVVRKDGRSISMRSNQVLAIVDAKGVEQGVNVVIADTPLTDAQKNQLKKLENAKEEEALAIVSDLANAPAQAMVDELRKLTASQKPEVRKYAANALVMIGAPETIRAGAAVALADKTTEVRRATANVLMNMAGVIGRADWRAELGKGLKDPDKDTRVVFALLLLDSATEDAGKVLVSDGVKHSDHHIRESAAEALAEHGNDGGMSVLIEMLVRTENPYLKANPKADASTKQTLIKVFSDEKVRVCGLMAKLKSAAAVKALTDAAKSSSPDLATAAKAALEQIQSGKGSESR